MKNLKSLSLTHLSYLHMRERWNERREKIQREEMRHAWVLRTSLQLKRSVLRFSTNINQETFRSSLSLPREDERRKAFSSRMIYLRRRALLFYFSRSQNDESKSCHQIKSLSLRERDFLNFSSEKLLEKKKYEMKSFWTIRFSVSFWLTKNYDYFDSSSIYHLSIINYPCHHSFEKKMTHNQSCTVQYIFFAPVEKRDSFRSHTSSLTRRKGIKVWSVVDSLDLLIPDQFVVVTLHSKQTL